MGEAMARKHYRIRPTLPHPTPQRQLGPVLATALLHEIYWSICQALCFGLRQASKRAAE